MMENNLVSSIAQVLSLSCIHSDGDLLCNLIHLDVSLTDYRHNHIKDDTRSSSL